MEHLLEYQDYLLAYRLRALIGGKMRPSGGYLSISSYADKRLTRQALAKEVVASADYRQSLGVVDGLTDELNFGFWHNPSETIKMMREVVAQGGCQALESASYFVQELLTKLEREQLSPAQLQLIGDYYLGLIRASAAYLDPEIFTRLRAEVEALREQLPIFVLPSSHTGIA